ncbi:MAG TPA: hypothetical protein VMW44_01050 [Candidatus Bathyarchaeia archaeon]|nr:hypothetical protein [Candidatus Bathyarchaeia archaeon]
MKPNTKVIRVLDIPEEVHSQFKALCARQRKSMNVKMIELMEFALRTNKMTIKD